MFSEPLETVSEPVKGILDPGAILSPLHLGLVVLDGGGHLTLIHRRHVTATSAWAVCGRGVVPPPDRTAPGRSRRGRIGGSRGELPSSVVTTDHTCPVEWAADHGLLQGSPVDRSWCLSHQMDTVMSLEPVNPMAPELLL